MKLFFVACLAIKGISKRVSRGEASKCIDMNNERGKAQGELRKIYIAQPDTGRAIITKVPLIRGIMDAGQRAPGMKFRPGWKEKVKEGR